MGWQFFNMLDNFRDVGVQPGSLINNFALRIQQRDEVGMGEFSLCLFFEFNSEDRGQILN